MSDYNSQYDPHIPKNGGGTGGGYYNGDSSAPAGGNSKTSNIQRDIDQTTQIMRDNIMAVRERGEGLDSLNDKTGEFVSFILCHKLRLSCCKSIASTFLLPLRNDNKF